MAISCSLIDFLLQYIKGAIVKSQQIFNLAHTDSIGLALIKYVKEVTEISSIQRELNWLGKLYQENPQFMQAIRHACRVNAGSKEVKLVDYNSVI